MAKEFSLERNMMHGDIFSFPSEDSYISPIYIELMGTDYCHESFYIKRVQSDVTVLAYVVSGHGILKIDNKTFTPSAGDLFLLPKGSSHEYFVQRNEPWQFKWFNVKGTLMDALLEVYKLEKIYVCENCNVEALFNRAINIAETETSDVHLQHKKIVMVIFEILIEVAEIVKKRKNIYSDAVLNIKNYLDNHIEKSVNLKDLSNKVAMSQRNINRIFKKEVGVTVYDYFLSKKMQLVQTLLINTNLSVKQISLRLNFTDVYYFSNLFKKKTGYSPLNYRKKFANT